MKQTRTQQDRLRPFKAMAFGSIVFFTVFGFPLLSPISPFGVADAFRVLAQAFIAGYLLAMVYGPGRHRLVYLASLALVALGMAGRFIMEYGEVSNAMNFTVVNIISYLAIIPGLILAAYWIILRNPELFRGGPRNDSGMK